MYGPGAGLLCNYVMQVTTGSFELRVKRIKELMGKTMPHL